MKCATNDPRIVKANQLNRDGARLLDKSKSGHSEAASIKLTQTNRLLYAAGCIKKGTLQK